MSFGNIVSILFYKVVVVVVVGATVVVVVVVVGLQHSYATISCQLPTLGFLRLRTKLPETTLPVPSNLTKALRSRLFGVILFII
jgi:hypothetical protein